MPVTLLHPGVYVQEVAGGSRAITGVATAVTAFVGRALSGPVDQPVPISSFAEFERLFGGLWRAAGLGYAVRDYYLAGGRDALVVRVAGGATAALIEVDDIVLQAAGLGPDGAAPSPGTWGDRLQIKIVYPAADDETAAVAQAQGVETDQLFQLTVRLGGPEDGGPSETYPNVTVADGPRRLDLVLRGSQLVRVLGDDLPDDLPDNRPGETPDPVTTTTQGSDGAALEAADYQAGLAALDQVELFTLLCLPPSDPQGDLPTTVWTEALAFCRRRDAFLLVDPPRLATASTVDNLGLTGPDARNAALYFPRLRRPDPLREGALREFVPSGTVAGVMARTDGARGVWKAPAGLEAGLTGVSGLSVTLDDAANGRLNPRGINCLRTFRDVGSVVWGARTLRGADVLADEYKYVPVRRFALFLKQSLYRGTQWVVFEPNDEQTWSSIRTSLTGFMQDLFRQGAFEGTTPAEAYFVKCDGETTTAYDRDRGVVNIAVGFAPLKPAEFVVVGIQQMTAAASA